MPLEIESVIIKILANSTQAVKDINKLDKSIEGVGKTSAASAKSIVGMAAAFGGARGVIDVVVKAIGSYVKYIKEAEAAYVAMAKEQNKALSDGVKAYDRLNKVREEGKILDGKISTERKAAFREWRADVLDTSNAIKALTDKEREYWEVQNMMAQAAMISMETLTSYAIRARADTAALGRELAQAAKSNTFVPSQLTGTQAKTPATTTAAVATTILGSTGAPNYSALGTQAFEAQMDRVTAYENREREAIISVNEMRQTAHDAEMAMIAEAQQAADDKRQADIDAASEIMMAWSNTLGAIGSLVRNSYQSQIDAAEQGSEKQKELMKKQFNAEKAMAIVQSLIATAVGITKAIPNIPLMAFSAISGAIQTAAIAAQKPPSFATGTPPGGYTVPSGYTGDTFPVRARSGERVTVDQPGSSGGNQTIILQLDGRVLGKAVTNLFDRRLSLVPISAVVA